MMKTHSIVRALCLVSIFICGVSFAQDVPYLSGRINDTAHMLSSETVTELEHTLKAYEDSTTNQFVVLTINSLDDYSIEDYALKVAETWKLGKKGVDNGALLLISKDDRKLRIEVGYGLEASLTDAATSYIINHKITPQFKQKDYDAGVKEGIQAMIAAADGTLDTSAGETASDSDEMSVGAALLFCSIWFTVVGVFTVAGLGSKGFQGWFLYVFLTPFYAAGASILGSAFSSIVGFIIFGAYIIGYPMLKYLLPTTRWGKKFMDSIPSHSSSGSGSSFFSMSSSSGSSSSSFSGGGGSFGGGGSSGGW
ncbi:MAG TPA: TPM domain-containing protein [Bacteroidota bacterium]|nr:TPM domain-containing protein [Bacteroidota bacterium]